MVQRRTDVGSTVAALSLRSLVGWSLDHDVNHLAKERQPRWGRDISPSRKPRVEEYYEIRSVEERRAGESSGKVAGNKIHSVPLGLKLKHERNAALLGGICGLRAAGVTGKFFNLACGPHTAGGIGA